jgi:hypothetical protein
MKRFPTPGLSRSPILTYESNVESITDQRTYFLLQNSAEDLKDKRNYARKFSVYLGLYMK